VPIAWPVLEASRITRDAAEYFLAQAEAMLKAQLEGADKLQSRLLTLLTLAVTLGSAALSAGAAALGLFGKSEGLVQQWPWFFAPPLLVAGGVWLLAAYTAAVAIQGVVLASPGKDPRSLCNTTFLEAERIELVLYMTRVVGEAIEENQKPVHDLARALRLASARLRFAPLWGAAIALIAAFLANLR
jgi:hypothetical protein